MSCARWMESASVLGGEPSARREKAIRHIQGCDECRRRAIEEDPSVLFAARLPGVAEPEQEAELMRQRVQAALGAREAERKAGEKKNRGRMWAVAATVAAMISALPFLWPDEKPEPALTQTVSAEKVFVEPQRIPIPDSGYAHLPLVEAASSPASATVYQWPEEEMSLVMIFDQRLDV